nr:pentatricopeptide repeat-containing protein At3g49170, chloroplastic [Ipomoea batatas]
MYSKCAADGSMDNSRKVFDRMPDHNVMSWTAAITGYVQTGIGDREAIDLYCRMIEGQVKPNHFTFSSLLKACGNLSSPDIGEQIYNHAVKSGLAGVNCVANALISMYAKSGRMEDARKAFEFLFEKNLVSYNIIVDGYAKNSDSMEAFELYSQTEESGVGVDAFTFASLLSAAASIGAVGKGEEIHAQLLKTGFQSNQSVCNALISMYSRCGNIEAALRVFDEMENRNIISWTAIITGFAKHGFAKTALELFSQMLRAGIKPNEVTYVAVLSACSHVGLVDAGWQHFNKMSKEHGISPRMEHYACMVDLLGRSGHLEKAVLFIKSMPFTPGALVWRTLLGACQVHGNVELGEHAAKMILSQDPNDPAAHVLLSNLYASNGNWGEVAQIRKDMKERKLVKEAGYSWIETENRINKFHVGDTKHPLAKEIYQELDRLATKIKALGYTPDTNLVLHEVEEEQKEQYLFQHSEKIAVAFGLISTSKPKPIRIFKNLRVCRDCHTAMKYITVATGREIVVRDSNRFHHIKDGACSCNDYW